MKSRPGQVRIIGGEWRGRKLTVPDSLHLRPTPDRVRETLFNWLSPVIAGAHCLDAFAGTGILGFEALSRGAAHVVMTESAKGCVQHMQDAAAKLQTHKAEIYQAVVPEDLAVPDKKFDVVFLDPPYQTNLLIPTCFYLEKQQFLADNCYIYLESNEVILTENLPPNWELLKSKKAGLVAYHLALRKDDIL